MENKFFGTGIALVTPFDVDRRIDYPALERLLEHVADGGVEYLVVCGTTGESVTLDKEEKKELTAFIRHYNDGLLPIVLGIGGNNTAEILKSIESQDFDGIDAILSVSPYYNKPTQEGIYQHYKAIATAAPRPVIIYNVPGRTGSNISASTTLRLAHDFPRIVAVKEASGILSQVMEIIREKPDGFEVISGDDNLTFPMMALGAAGVISVVGQAYPKAFSTMVRLCLGGLFEEAREIHYTLFEFTNDLFADGSPGGIKCALKAMGICEDYLRLPLVPPCEDVRERIRAFALQKK